MVMIGAVISGIFNTILVQLTFEKYGEVFIMNFVGTISTVGLLLSLIFNPNLDLKRLENKGLIVWHNKNENENKKY